MLFSLSALVACGQGGEETPPVDNNSNSSQSSEAEGGGVLHYSEDGVITYFLESTEDAIDLNISQARADYLVNEEGAEAIDDMMYILQVERTDDLEIVDEEGKELGIEDLQEGDKVYLDLQIEEYLDNEEMMTYETDRIVVGE